jgi:uncharacterized protein YbjT (DUF2867 family)/uncharacterized protein YndB with AHSA1/START domain
MTGNRSKKTILVVGATGYVGGRLVPLLASRGYKVRAMGRSLDKLNCRPWARHPKVETVEADVLDRQAFARAAMGCSAAFYLVHSMIAAKKGYAGADRQGALNMAAVAAARGLRRIIYLGGLGDRDDHRISRHLRSRHEVEKILAAGPVPVTNLRAAMILGSGSASFEMLRYLVERLPVMTPPRWVNTPCQPIAIADVLDYLVASLESDATAGDTFDIGGPDIVTYRDLIRIYADEAGLVPRMVIPIPVLTPYLSAKWIHLVTPVPAAIAQPLAEGLATPVICRDDRIVELIPFNRTQVRAAIRMALDKTLGHQVDSCWYDAGELLPPAWASCGDADWAGGTLMTCGYRVRIKADPDAVWEVVRMVGGDRGWFYADALWWLRGLLDRLAGGVGLRRGRRHPKELWVGDGVDFWRVLEVRQNRKLVLLAEMKMPGEATLTFEITPFADGTTQLTLLSRFLPQGIAGIVYWYGLYPFHEIIFFGMAKAMANATGKTIMGKPERFTPRLAGSCLLPK